MAIDQRRQNRVGFPGGKNFAEILHSLILNPTLFWPADTDNTKFIFLLSCVAVLETARINIFLLSPLIWLGWVGVISQEPLSLIRRAVAEARTE